MAKTSSTRCLSLTLLLSCGAVMAAAQHAAAANSGVLQTGEQQLSLGRTNLEEGTLLAARKSFEQCLRQNRNEQCAYDLASADSYLAQAKESHKDHKGAGQWLDSAIEDAKQAVIIDDRSSDAHALLADLYGRKIGLGGMFAGVHYGPKANAEMQRAFELDPNNPRAYVVVGRKYLYAPRIFGGDLQKAIESFRKATALDPHDDEAFVWLAIAYRKNGKTRQSQAALSEALRLNPRSVFVQQVQSAPEER
jgi:tetratricopeptide (TPR) repeat protein